MQLNEDKIHLQLVAPAKVRETIVKDIPEGVMGGH